jgi:hypothetical protein
VFEALPPGVHTVTAETDGNGTAHADPDRATAGTEITLTAMPSEGYRFMLWQILPGNIAVTDGRFTMPDSDVKVRAVFGPEQTDPGGGNGGNGGSGGSAARPPERPPDSGAVSGSVRGDGGKVGIEYSLAGDTAVLLITDEKAESLLGAASGGRIDVDLSVLNGIYAVSLPKTALGRFAEENCTFEANFAAGSITVGAEAGRAIAGLAAGDRVELRVTAEKAAALAPAQRAAVKPGSEIYDVGILSGGEYIPYFSGATVTVFLPYALKEGETPGGVGAYRVEPDGGLTDMRAAYDTGLRGAVFTTDHLSAYAVAHGGTAWENPFRDVRGDDWFFGDVMYAAENGLLVGVGGSEFRPGAPLTRAMWVTALYRLSGTPAAPRGAPFTDTAGGSWYYAAAAWGAAAGAVTGYGDGSFRPDAGVTRAELAVMLYRLAPAGWHGPAAGEPPFADAAAVGGWAREAVAVCAARGIITGRPGNIFDPAGAATRAEAAAMLRRFSENAG